LEAAFLDQGRTTPSCNGGNINHNVDGERSESTHES